ncbi:2-hydroxychromene-2-carboxylate isomerase [Vibrio sp. MACH09]|uniref:DsbA family oxidoreductase n=1 Tax=Vibrio sp. MACH09 TaxID=3025122 RepID=UPI0027931347|nr:DsbA family oxidoreductase [Vibrio sp. MACH09]GLO62574.1 2-hydroxychromene-2-carboxylate isomerase [Vibrio sp. MACH09]
MSKTIKLDIISDVVCPWCVIGYKHLEAAIEELAIQDKVEIEWQPFELNPDMPAEGEGLREHIARKYGSSREESDQARANITQHGSQYGFQFDFFEEMNMVNTLDAHVLLDFAHQVGKQTELKLRLFSAYFTEHKDVSDREVLIKEAESVGIAAEHALAALADEQIRERVKGLEAQWQQMGVSGVPTVVFNRTSALTGAQPQETFKQVLTELLEE